MTKAKDDETEKTRRKIADVLGHNKPADAKAATGHGEEKPEKEIKSGATSNGQVSITKGEDA